MSGLEEGLGTSRGDLQGAQVREGGKVGATSE